VYLASTDIAVPNCIREINCMFRVMGKIGAAVLLVAINSLSFCQLRNISPYSADRINTDKTYFVLKDATTAGFGWASEWTQGTVQDFSEKHPFFVWHFKDGSKAYSRHDGYFGDLGQGLGYLLANESASLETATKDKIQPLTSINVPVRVELWLGEDQAGLKPETHIDTACFEEEKIESGRVYHFSDCK
jgi:hypothetical protein